MNVTIKGLEPILKKLGPDLFKEPLDNFYKRAAIKVQGSARTLTPVDTGGLRNKVMYEVTPDTARVGFLSASEGSELFAQARAMEYGTGTRGDPDVSHTAGHFPPPGKLEVWATRHGFASGFIVARAIARRGGLKARRMLRDGLADSRGAIEGYVKQLGDEIRAKWDK